MSLALEEPVEQPKGVVEYGLKYTILTSKWGWFLALSGCFVVGWIGHWVFSLIWRMFDTVTSIF